MGVVGFEMVMQYFVMAGFGVGFGLLLSIGVPVAIYRWWREWRESKRRS